MRFVLLLLPPLAISAAYQYVSRQIASGQIGGPFVGSPVTFKPIDPSILTAPQLSFDSRDFARMNSQNIVNQNRLFNQRMEDIRNYARNPAGWHGAPPF
jgi:hypothetical protein